MNKSIIVFVLLACSKQLVYAQSPKSLKDKVSLDRQAEVATETTKNPNKQIQVYLDYLTDELVHHRNRIVELQKDSASLQQLIQPNSAQVGQDNKASVSYQKVDSISILNAKYVQLNDSLNSKIKANNELIAKEKEYNESLNLVSKFYSYPMDTLIKYSTENSINRDKVIFDRLRNLPARFASLITYYEAKALLNERYDSIKTETAKAKLRKIESCKSVEALIGNLSYYVVINNSLKKTLNNIISIDITQKASEQSVIVPKKQKDILVKFAEFYRDNEHELGVYNYLDQIVKSVLREKVKNVDVDIKLYVSKL
jgi:hypothetical protein